MNKYKEIIPIRNGQDFNRPRLTEYLKKRIALPGNTELEVQQFSAGMANYTYLIKFDNWKAVLRRPPNGPLPPKAHDMGREYNFFEKVYKHFPLVPKPFLFCDDKSIIGVPFYIMEYKEGTVLDKKFPDDIKVTDELLKQISNEVVNSLVNLHQLDYKKIGLESLGHPIGFLERQVFGWIKRHENSKTHSVPYYNEVKEWLTENIPNSTGVSIIHNDYKLNNIVLSPDLKEIRAILDWEMVTIGDPLFDLANALAYWTQHDDSPLVKGSLFSITATPGFFTREEFIHQYSLGTKQEITNIDFYLAAVYFKITGAVQQMFYRYKIGQTNDERYSNLDIDVNNLMKFIYQQYVQK
ncbi:phosphotransferase family protein [Oceanobacillus piezotolerans]|uniref:Phosphotransferase family protein n=1 Tax=Oceanobacillus piezotolerans TaxID=2448030 RepID=A0A498DD13_9BACI|nr:phosphotransferase family protein [Oceanobacillus piezotolerans]RLL46857.1 phosphotransferase family protein [Oceanobacillus piezotolerans]